MHPLTSWITPKILEIFHLTDKMWGFQLNSLSNVNPRNIYLSDLGYYIIVFGNDWMYVCNETLSFGVI